jgi:S-adenosylmethionine synthetase
MNLFKKSEIVLKISGMTKKDLLGKKPLKLKVIFIHNHPILQWELIQKIIKMKVLVTKVIMFGYACNETEELMPAPIHYSHKILRLMAEDRKSGKLKNIEPDSKSQVTFEYIDGKPSKVKSVVISSQHSAEVNQDKVKELLRPYMIQVNP